mgnify:CR=1 FL=1
MSGTALPHRRPVPVRRKRPNRPSVDNAHRGFVASTEWGPVHADEETDLFPALLESMTEEIALAQATLRAADLIDGKIRGRLVVRITK